ncbi:MAG: UDP-2,3-diacylglucosamine diphosphatase [Pseudomonadota bacterium]
MTDLFISDLHIDESAPEIGQQLIEFLKGPARSCRTLYVLGDLFEAWIGDDDPNPHFSDIQDALAALTHSGVRGYFMHGNRDFLIGEAFAARTGLEILTDPVVHTINDTPVLLSHGDLYCTDDNEYQAVRRTVRSVEWQAQVLALPLEARRQLAGQARAESTDANAKKSEDIMDVNQAAIDAALAEHNVTKILHGHTHRPAVHEWQLPSGLKARRMVLGDWYTQGSVGVWDETGFRLETLAR